MDRDERVLESLGDFVSGPLVTWVSVVGRGELCLSGEGWEPCPGQSSVSLSPHIPPFSVPPPQTLPTLCRLSSPHTRLCTCPLVLSLLFSPAPPLSLCTLSSPPCAAPYPLLLQCERKAEIIERIQGLDIETQTASPHPSGPLRSFLCCPPLSLPPSTVPWTFPTPTPSCSSHPI
uniref:Uncharacterized protein n=1 Tax=Chelonoidis abingdonii TaxID=106734 RepID=A0A8C0FX92_CHEAB